MRRSIDCVISCAARVRPKTGRPQRVLYLFAVLICALGEPSAPWAKPSTVDPVDEAFVAAQLAMASSAGSALKQNSVRLAARDPALAALVRQRQNLTEKALELESELNAVSDVNEGVSIRGHVDSLHAEIALIDKTLNLEFPEYAALVHPEPLRIADVQALLNGREALLLILSGEESVFLFAIGEHRVAWHRTPFGSDVLSDDVTKLRRQLDPNAVARGGSSLASGVDGPQIPPFDRQLAHAIYSALLAPLEQVIVHADHLLIVAEGAMAGIPLSLLVTEPPNGADTDPEALRKTSWLIASHAVTTLPDVASLAAIKREDALEQRPLNPNFAGFGAPLLGSSSSVPRPRSVGTADTYFRGALADVEAVRNLPPLPQTGHELRALAASVEGTSTLFLGEDATELSVKRTTLSSYSIVAFATHGLVSGELKGLAEPALVLTPPEVATVEDDGLLTASEVAGLELSADWVLLSACNTAASDGRPDAEGLSGLARAFLYAGARSILVSHWPVRDDAAARLTTETFSRIAATEGLSKAQALRQSMLALMADDRDYTFAHPSAWAPFVIVGDSD